MPRFLYFFAVCIPLLVAGCTSVFGDVRATFDYAFQEQNDVRLSVSEIDEFSYTALYANWDGKPRVLIVLGFIEGSEHHWVTGDSETLITSYGRVVRTALLEQDLVHLSDLQRDPLRCIGRQDLTECSLRWTRVGQFESKEGEFRSARIESEFEVVGHEALQLPRGEVEALKVLERSVFGVGNEELTRFENIFWLAADGHVLKSVQHLGPKQPSITLTQVKWVGRDD